MTPEKMQFHFPCFALCQVDLYEDGTADADSTVSILGFWPSRQRADLAARGYTEQARVPYGAWRQMSGLYSPAHFKPSHFEIVALDHVSFDYLSDLAGFVENAARARVIGVGKEPSRPLADEIGAALAKADGAQ